jgi:hypothetical protein
MSIGNIDVAAVSGLAHSGSMAKPPCRAGA